MTPRLNREQIIEAAFRAWGRTFFMRTGLDLVARELGVTKPAMYRYFRNKDEVIYALEEDYDRLSEQYIVTPLQSLQASSKVEAESVIRTYFTGVFRLFEEHPYHYPFFLRRIIGRLLRDGTDVRNMRHRTTTLLVSLFSTARHLPAGETVAAVRYLTMSAVFWMTHHYRKTLDQSAAEDQVFQPESFSLGSERRANLIDDATRHFMHGFAPNILPRIDFDGVDRIATIAPEEIPQPDRVMTAITAVVEEYGYADATVERIAAQLGRSKSSLYHYFANRDEMLSRMLMEFQERFAAIASLRFRQLACDDERLYGLFVLLADWAVLSPGAAIVENWVRESNIEVQIPHTQLVELKKIYTFITDMLVQGELAGSPDDAFGILQFVSFIVMQEIAVQTHFGRDTRRYRSVVRELFIRFAGGYDRPTGGDTSASRSNIDREKENDLT